jgi:NADH-quinone oxidoreductase subunit H
MIVGSGIFCLLFLGGWNPLPWVSLGSFINLAAGVLPCVASPLFMGVIGITFFLLKVGFFIFFFMWVRWTLPRFRYDQVMNLGWKKLLPISIANLIFYAVAIAVKDLCFPNL